MTNWWSDIDDAVLACLADGARAPAEIARQLGMSEAATRSLVALLAQEGRVEILAVGPRKA